MGWATPAAFWWILAAVPLVMLFMLRLVPRQQVVSTWYFWDQASPEGRAVRWIHHWRDRLMFLFNLLLLLLLVLALAEPIRQSAVTTRQDWVIFLDNSASMQARQEGTTRWQLLSSRVDQFLADLPESARVTFVLAATSPHPLHLPAHLKPSSARRLLQAVAPSDAPGSLRERWRVYAESSQANDANQVSIAMATDPGQRKKLSEAIDRPVQWVLAGEPLENSAITQFQVRRSLGDPYSIEIWVELSHFGTDSRETQLELFLGDQLLDVVPLTLLPEQTWHRTWTRHSAAGGQLTIRLTSDDALALDNQAVAVLEPRPSQKVLLVTTGDLYLEKVLRAIPWVALEVSDQIPEELPSDTVLVVHRQAVAQLPAGPALLVDLRESSESWRLGDEAFETLVSRQATSPWLAHVQLLDQILPGVRSLEFLQPAQVLLEAADGSPIYALLEHAAGRALVLNVDLQQGDLPWRTAFPLLIVNGLQGLSASSADYQPAVRTGQTVVQRALPSDPPSPMVTEDRSEERWTLVSPSGERRKLPQWDGQWMLGELCEAGFWKIVPSVQPAGDGSEAADSTSRATDACNLMDAAESDLRWDDRDAVASSASRAAWTDAWGSRGWRWLVVVALLVSVVEWFLYQRRWIG